MVIVNCTLKLSKRLPFLFVKTPEPSTNLLGSWCANVFNHGRQPLLIFTNERTLLTVILSQRTVHSIWGRFLVSLEDLLRFISVPSRIIQGELERLQQVQFSRSTNRQVLGSMSDFVSMARLHFESDPNLPIRQLNLMLNEAPCSPLNMDSPKKAILDFVTNELRR